VARGLRLGHESTYKGVRWDSEAFSSIVGRGARRSKYTPMHFHMAKPGWLKVIFEIYV
jgi:hypothetical protein